MDRPVIARSSPYDVEVEEGKTYAWCFCGQSATQPFCDGSHEGTGFSPRPFKAEKTETVYFCGWKRTKSQPLCDGSHSSL